MDNQLFIKEFVNETNVFESLAWFVRMFIVVEQSTKEIVEGTLFATHS